MSTPTSKASDDLAIVTNWQQLLGLIDKVWNAATESEEVPHHEWASRLINDWMPEQPPGNETGEQQPVAYVPIHPRTGPLWANTIPTLESERPAHYPLMALYAEPAYRDGKETVVRTNQGDSDCVMTGDWPLTRERDAASHPPSCVCYTCIQNRWRASQKASEVRTWICPNCKSENRDDYHRISCPGCGKLRPPSSSEEV